MTTQHYTKNKDNYKKGGNYSLLFFFMAPLSEKLRLD